jgi:prevent-host-death family protein
LVKRRQNGQGGDMAAFNLYEAKTSLSQLVERAAKGEEIIIAKAGKQMVKMVPVKKEHKPKRRRSGLNTLGITDISPDFGKPIWTDEELEKLGLA